MANTTNEQIAAEALVMLQDSKAENLKPKYTFVIPFISTPFMTGPPQVSLPTQPQIPTTVKRKRAYHATSSPIPRNKGRFAKKESLFVPKPARKAFTGIISNI